MGYAPVDNVHISKGILAKPFTARGLPTVDCGNTISQATPESSKRLPPGRVRDSIVHNSFDGDRENPDCIFSHGLCFTQDAWQSVLPFINDRGVLEELGEDEPLDRKSVV